MPSSRQHVASPAQLMPGRTFTSMWHQGTFGTFSNSPQYEYLISLWELDDGQQMLCDFLNRQLRADEFPSALREAQVALIPAIIAITGHGGHRPRHLLEYHGFNHLDGDNIMRDQGEKNKELTAGLVKAFYEHWFKNRPAPEMLWTLGFGAPYSTPRKPYLDALASQCLEDLKSHDRIALTFSVYRREARDYFRQLLPGRVSFLKLDCDPDVVVRSALARLEKYMALSGKTVEDWWKQEKKDQVYGEYSYESYKKMQLAEFLSGMEPFDPEEDWDPLPTALLSLGPKLCPAMAPRPWLTSLLVAVLFSMATRSALRFTPGLTSPSRSTSAMAVQAARKKKVAVDLDAPPKRPLTSYMRFAVDVRPEVAEEMEGAKPTESPRSFQGHWVCHAPDAATLLSAHRAVEDFTSAWDLKLDAEWEEYRQQKQAFLDAGGVLPAPQRRTADGKVKVVKDPLQPKKPGSTYILWVKDNYAKLRKKNPKLEPKEVMSQAGKEWSKATKATKTKYEKKRAELMKEYEKAMEAYKSS
eukprot:s4386_g2.t1